MSVQAGIKAYIAGLPEAKRADMETLHRLALKVMPGARLWFLDGKDDKGKIVSNPNIGYGLQTMTYADGKSRDFYQVGISANTAGISVYIMGLDDQTWLARTYGRKLGKAKVTGYCIRFKALKDTDATVLAAVMRDAAAKTSA